MAQTPGGAADDNSPGSEADITSTIPPLAPRPTDLLPAGPPVRPPAPPPPQPPRRVETPPPRKSAEIPGRPTFPPNQPGPAAGKPEPGPRVASREPVNAAPGRPSPEALSPQEAPSSRQTLAMPSSRPGNQGGSTSDHPPQPPPAYPTASVSAVGLLCQSITADTARQLGLDAPRGMWCTGVTAGSAAALAGIRSNDVLLSIDGTDMRDLSGLRKIAGETSAGSTVPVEIFRNGNRRTVQLSLDQLR
jgi:hypothetical protein